MRIHNRRGTLALRNNAVTEGEAGRPRLSGRAGLLSRNRVPADLFEGSARRPDASIRIAPRSRVLADAPPLPVAVDRTLEVTPQDQGQTNACGTTSLAMLFSFWGRPAPHDSIDSQIRNLGMYTAPDDLVDYANSHGMRASIKNEASMEDIAKLIDQGVPCEVLTEAPGAAYSAANGENHYIVVNGYQRDASGKITGFEVTDPWGLHRHMDAADFDKRWSDSNQAGIGTGNSRILISMVPADDRMISGTDGLRRRAGEISLPSDSISSYLDGIAFRTLERRLADVTNGIARLDLGSVLGGVFGLACGAPLFCLQKVFSWIPIPGLDRIPEVLSAGVNLVGGWIKTGGNIISDGIKAGVSAVGSVVNAVGSAASSVGSAIGSAVSSIGSFFGF